MSIKSLFVENPYTLYCDTLNANHSNINELIVQELDTQILTTVDIIASGTITAAIITTTNGFSYEEFSLPDQTVSFNSGGEQYTSNFQVRGVATATQGLLAGIKLTKIGNTVNMIIPAFTGNKSGTSSRLMTVVSSLPAMFTPVNYQIQMSVNAWNNGHFVSAGQDFANVYVNTSNEIVIDAVTGTNGWFGNCGIKNDLCLSWMI